MNAAGTLSHATVEWRTINWRRINRNVRRLQIRIAEAMKQGRRGKVHALRRILTRALCAACRAVRKVTESRVYPNKGTKSPTGLVLISDPHDSLSTDAELARNG